MYRFILQDGLTKSYKPGYLRTMSLFKEKSLLFYKIPTLTFFGNYAIMFLR